MKVVAKDLQPNDFFRYGEYICLILDIKQSPIDESVLDFSFIKNGKFFTDFKVGANSKLTVP